MNQESLTKLRLDRRLATRRGWIKGAEFDKALEDLPDVASKATTLGEADDAAKGEAQQESGA